MFSEDEHQSISSRVSNFHPALSEGVREVNPDIKEVIGKMRELSVYDKNGILVKHKEHELSENKYDEVEFRRCLEIASQQVRFSF